MMFGVKRKKMVILFNLNCEFFQNIVYEVDCVLYINKQEYCSLAPENLPNMVHPEAGSRISSQEGI